MTSPRAIPLVVGSLLALCAGCASSASLPPAVTGVAPAEREATYQRYKLSYQYNAFSGGRWKRADGEYMLGQLDNVLAAYPETAAGADKMKARGAVIGGLAAVGGAVLGFTFGRNVLGPERAHWSSGQRAAAMASAAP